MLRITRFPYDYEATHFLASPQLQTPWLVFQDEWHNTSQNKRISNVTKRNPNKNHSFHAMPGCHHLVSGTFHPQINGFFSAFPRGTKYTIGLEKYSELEVDASQKIHAQFPMNATQEKMIRPIHPKSTGLSPSTVKVFQQ